MRLNHVTLQVRDLDRAVGFYRRLGLTQLVGSDGYARFQAPEGDSTLSLESRGGEPDNAGTVTIYFESDRLDQLVAELKAEGFEFEQDPVDQPYLWREAVLRDPDGHRLLLYHAGVNRLDPPWRLPSPDPPPPSR
jgi:catechol 2,3-dioxygenase-like lactoylglutathione lyase family enzyme